MMLRYHRPNVNKAPDLVRRPSILILSCRLLLGGSSSPLIIAQFIARHYIYLASAAQLFVFPMFLTICEIYSQKTFSFFFYSLTQPAIMVRLLFRLRH